MGRGPERRFERACEWLTDSALAREI